MGSAVGGVVGGRENFQAQASRTSRPHQHPRSDDSIQQRPAGIDSTSRDKRYITVSVAGDGGGRKMYVEGGERRGRSYLRRVDVDDCKGWIGFNRREMPLQSPLAHKRIGAA
jgi:hypothetical protein